MDESLETSFQALEIVNNAYVESPRIQPRLSDTSLMEARVMLKDGYEPNMGLGQNGDGVVSLLEIVKNCGKFGLGYKPTSADRKSVV